jgi:ABC-type arginine transport system ATPase subunit
LEHVGDQFFIIESLTNCSKGVAEALDLAEIVGDGEVLLLDGGEPMRICIARALDVDANILSSVTQAARAVDAPTVVARTSSVIEELMMLSTSWS